MKKLALLGLVVAAAGCAFHRHHETINKSVPGRTAILARLAGSNPDAATVTVTTETGDSRVFRVAPAVQGTLADLRVGAPIVIAFDLTRGDTVVSIQPAALRPSLASSIILPAPLPMIRTGLLFHGTTPREGMEAALNARVVSVAPGESRLIIRTAEGERVLTVAPAAAAALNELGPGDEIVVGFDSAARDSVVLIERSAAPTPPPGPRGSVVAPEPAPRPAEANAAPAATTNTAAPTPARRRTPRRGTSRTGTRRARPAGGGATAGAPAAGTATAAPPAAAPTPVPPRGAASPMPTARPVPTPRPVPSPRSATTPEPFPPVTPTPAPTATPR
jgi:hypothetical protein